MSYPADTVVETAIRTIEKALKVDHTVPKFSQAVENFQAVVRYLGTFGESGYSALRQDDWSDDAMRKGGSGDIAYSLSVTISADAADAGVSEFRTSGGDGYDANGSVDLPVGIIFRKLGTAAFDLTDNKFATAKGGALVLGDLFEVTGADAVTYYDSAVLPADTAIETAFRSFEDALGEDITLQGSVEAIQRWSMVVSYIEGLGGSGYSSLDQRNWNFQPLRGSRDLTGIVDIALSSDSADAGVSEFIGGGDGDALSNGDSFRITTAIWDLTDNAFATAKGSAVAAGDYYRIDGADSVEYLYDVPI